MGTVGKNMKEDITTKVTRTLMHNVVVISDLTEELSLTRKELARTNSTLADAEWKLSRVRGTLEKWGFYNEEMKNIFEKDVEV